jgi:hypothetical protein
MFTDEQKRKYINEYGLLNSRPQDINAENAPLWSLEYLILREMLADPSMPLKGMGTMDYYDEYLQIETKLDQYVDLSYAGKQGLYHNVPFDCVHPHDKYMSPDQLIAFAAAKFRLNKYREVEDMWRFLKRHFFTYDNLTGKSNFKRTMQPSAVAFLGALNGSSFWEWVVACSCVNSCEKAPHKTSGALKAFCMMQTLYMDDLFEECTKILNENGTSWKKVFRIYFPLIDHPIHTLVEDLNV